jgi:Asp-tRNA(Asn)/Glu-tRNA(Gln) amidotransferase A subunit family amidase
LSTESYWNSGVRQPRFGGFDPADVLDRAAAAGTPKGPLFCMPVAVKDNFDT